MKSLVSSLVVAGCAASAFAQVQDAYKALETKPIWVHSSAGSRVDASKIERAIDELSPRTIKVLVVPNLGGRWVRNGVEQRGSYAEWLFRDQLKLKDGMTVVLTRKGIAAFDPKVPKPRLASMNDASAKIAQREGFTAGILDSIATVSAASAASAGQATAPTTNAPPIRSTTSPTQSQSGGGFPIWWLILGGGGVGGFFLFKSMKEKARLESLRQPLRIVRSDLVSEIDWIDSYDGLLEEPVASQVRGYRTRANEAWERTGPRIDTLKNDSDTYDIRNRLEAGLRDSHAARNLIEEATGGTKSAFRLPESLEEVDKDIAPLYDPKPGYCFFTGMASSNRVPIEFSVDGQRMTVLASPEVADKIRRGESPTIAGAQVDGSNQPWFNVPNYRSGVADGGLGSSFISNLLLFNLASNALSFNHWGHSSHTHESNAYDSSGGFDSSWDGGFSDSGSFDSSDSGGSDYSGSDDFGGSFD